MGPGDSIIYATAKREEAKVMTGDQHFRGLNEVIFLERRKITVYAGCYYV